MPLAANPQDPEDGEFVEGGSTSSTSPGDTGFSLLNTPRKCWEYPLSKKEKDKLLTKTMEQECDIHRADKEITEATIQELVEENSLLHTEKTELLKAAQIGAARVRSPAETPVVPAAPSHKNRTRHYRLSLGAENPNNNSLDECYDALDNNNQHVDCSPKSGVSTTVSTRSNKGTAAKEMIIGGQEGEDDASEEQMVVKIPKTWIAGVCGAFITAVLFSSSSLLLKVFFPQSDDFTMAPYAKTNDIIEADLRQVEAQKAPPLVSSSPIDNTAMLQSSKPRPSNAEIEQALRTLAMRNETTVFFPTMSVRPKYEEDIAKRAMEFMGKGDCNRANDLFGNLLHANSTSIEMKSKYMKEYGFTFYCKVPMDLEMAFDVFSEAIALSEDNQPVWLWTMMGNIMAKGKLIEQALYFFEKAVDESERRKEMNIVVYNNYAAVMVLLAKYHSGASEADRTRFLNAAAEAIAFASQEDPVAAAASEALNYNARGVNLYLKTKKSFEPEMEVFYTWMNYDKPGEDASL